MSSSKWEALSQPSQVLAEAQVKYVATLASPWWASTGRRCGPLASPWWTSTGRRCGLERSSWRLVVAAATQGEKSLGPARCIDKSFFHIHRKNWARQDAPNTSPEKWLGYRNNLRYFTHTGRVAGKEAGATYKRDYSFF